MAASTEAKPVIDRRTQRTRLGFARMPQEWYCTSGGTFGYSGGSWMSKKKSWSWYGVPAAPATAARSRSILPGEKFHELRVRAEIKNLGLNEHSMP